MNDELYSDIDHAIESIPTIDINRNYWLMRTMGGQYYNDFILNDFIAIGYDKITTQVIRQSIKELDPVATMIKTVKINYPKEKRFGVAANQLLNFVDGMKAGDVVIIPGEGSYNFSIGILDDNIIYSEENKIMKADYIICPFIKRRNVTWWLKNQRFELINPKLIPLKYTHQALTSVTDPSIISVIDRLISPIYVKNGQCSLVLQIRRKEPIRGFDFFSTWIELFGLAEDFGNQYDLGIKKEDFDVKLSVESPGEIIITATIVAVLAISILIGTFAGIELEGEVPGKKLKIKTPGLLKAATNYKIGKQKEKMYEKLNEKLSDMELDKKDVIEIIKIIENKEDE